MIVAGAVFLFIILAIYGLYRLPVGETKKPEQAESEETAPTPSQAPKGKDYMVPAMLSFLAQIRAVEAGKGGYNADFRNDDKWDLVHLPLDYVIKLSKSQVKQGEGSSAIGGYQFLSKTLEWLKKRLKLDGSETFNQILQDDMAITLLIRRGLFDFLRGKIAAETFADNIAKEWASFPVTTDQQGHSRYVKKGQSYYAGDGLNKALVKPEVVLSLLHKLKDQSWLKDTML